MKSPLRSLHAQKWAKPTLLTLLSVFPLATAMGNHTVDVSNFSELRSAIEEANSYTAGGTFTIRLQSSIDASSETDASQLFIGLQSDTNLVLNGMNRVINMAQKDRVFYVAQGNVTFTNMTISGGMAKGGDGGAGGGGGMGAGGTIYVANRGSGTQVTVSNIRITNSTAQGGNGGVKLTPTFDGDIDEHRNTTQGGGGGMGGNGGFGNNVQANPAKETYGGGGGFGINASGGTGSGSEEGQKVTNGGTGAYTGGASGGQGYEEYSHGYGGSNGGGGGSSYNEESGKWAKGAAGGGGVGGYDGLLLQYASDLPFKGYGGVGNYGGGGGAASHFGGDGGFGGGGGASYLEDAGKGGFGGGGGISDSVNAGGEDGGFGGGSGQRVFNEYPEYYGGGGMGAGGAIFVEKGATLLADASGHVNIVNNTVTGGTGASETLGAGSAVGANIFLGGDVTFYIDAGTVLMSDLGGSGDTSVANIAGRDTDGNAQGGVIKTGTGTLKIEGYNSYAGATEARGGVLRISASQIFTSSYIVRDGATLDFDHVNLTAAEITTEEGATVTVNWATVDFSNTTFTSGTILINGEARGLNVADTSVRVGGTGTLDNFASAATFTASSLTLNDTTWVTGSTLEFDLGSTSLTSTGTSDFSLVDEEGLIIDILSLLDGTLVGDRMTLITFDDTTLLDLSKFLITSDIQGFSGQLYQELSGDNLVLGLRVAAIPEPTSLYLLGLGAIGLHLSRRRVRGKTKG